MTPGVGWFFGFLVFWREVIPPSYSTIIPYNKGLCTRSWSKNDRLKTFFSLGPGARALRWGAAPGGPSSPPAKGAPGPRGPYDVHSARELFTNFYYCQIKRKNSYI